MFGWLTGSITPSCPYAPLAIVSRRMLRITPRHLMHWLPRLGNVLYLHAPSAVDSDTIVPPRVLLAQQTSVPLMETHWLIAVSVVTDDGPREWCECVDRRGRLRARLHLLPDTDYLAWDGLVATAEAGRSPLPPPRAASRDALMPWADYAHVVHFQVRELAGLLLLEQHAAISVSQLSGTVAARIARAESTVLR